MKMKLLLADDDTGSLTELERRFLDAGFQVAAVRNGVEAMEHARNQPLDVIVLDTRMPQLNGYQACRRLKEDGLLTKVPVVLLAEQETEEDRFWGEEVGADLCLARPIGIQKIVESVKELID